MEPGWLEAEPAISNSGGGYPRGLAVAPNNSDIVSFTNLSGVYSTDMAGLRGCLASLLGYRGPSWDQAYTEQVGGAAEFSPYVGIWRSIGLEVTTCWRYQILSDVHFICYSDIGLARSTDGEVWTWSGLKTNGSE